MKALRAAAMIALLAGPAYAQDQAPIQRAGEPDKEKSARQIQDEKAAQKAYEQSLGNIPEKAATDPWGNARSIDAPKAATKTVTKTTPPKLHAKTGSTAN
ncbi:MAG: hypothetical protein E7813_04630 [Bradyrhizobium sp.]|uniref:hypothetical protein n=1 Tax=Bradyrhizobium sp. TaxID=376 RepID=UPI00120D149F|nr:hypothetical protein [Bradyrhizobium sp.]THD71944.1 MAG: hypothetical protein E7813_04630 [Bradyrhizobium sp.]